MTGPGISRAELATRFIHILGQRRCLTMLGLCALTSVASALEVIGILLIFPLIRMLYRPDFIHNTTVLEQVYVSLGFTQERWFILAFGGLLLGVFIVKNLYVTSVYLLQRRFARAGAASLSSHLRSLYLGTPYIMLMNRNSSELIRNVRTLAPKVYFKVALGVVNLFAEGVVILGVALVLLFIEPLVTMVVSVVVGVLFATQSYIYGTRLQRWGTQAMELSREGHRKLNETLQAVKEIRVLGREEHFLGQLDEIHQHEAELAGNRQFLNDAIRPTTEIVMLCGIFAVITILLLSRGPGESLPGMALFAVAGIRLVPTLNRFFRWFGEVRHGVPAIRKIFAETTRLGPDNPRRSQPVEKLPFRDAIQLENLKFRYPGSRMPALKPTDASIQRGQYVGIVGRSGAGKSTLINLILGLLTPTEGRLLVDSRDIAEHTSAWQANIGYVPQTLFFLDDTVRRNVAFGIADELIDDDRIVEALTLACLGPDLDELPGGLDGPVGENAVRASGGQRQRLAIARALYHDPEVLIMDEVTADLDNETEQAVTETLAGLKGKKTIIVIAHRLRTVRDCDTLFFMQNGRIVDRGSFEELKQRNEGFRRLAELEEPQSLKQNVQETSS